MIRSSIYVFFAIIVFVNLSCKETVVGIDGLFDPYITPRVLYTFPPPNSAGPYDNFTFPRMEIWFNKLMERTSVRRALSISSSLNDARIDTNNIYFDGTNRFSFYVSDTSSSYYSPSYRWKMGVTYKLSISSAAQDVFGNHLSPYSMMFMPEPYFRVRRIYPENGTTNWSSGSVELYFNSKVDSSIGSFIQFSPPVSGYWYIPSYDSSTAYFSPIQPSGFKENTTYTITMNTGAHDKYGNHLTQPFVSSFSTTSFKITSAYPYGQNISMSSGISISCSAAYDTGSVRKAFKIVPTTSGYFSLYDGSTYLNFYPDDGLNPETNYEVTIDTSFRSRAGGRLASAFQFSFRTEAFKVEGSYPYSNSTDVSRNLYSIDVYCNAIIDTGTIRSAFSIPGITGHYYLYSGTSSFTFYPDNTPLPANTTYIATVSTALKSKNGYALKAPYIFSFTTGN